MGNCAPGNAPRGRVRSADGGCIALLASGDGGLLLLPRVQAVPSTSQLVKYASEDGPRIQLIINNVTDSGAQPLTYQLHTKSMLKPSQVGEAGRGHGQRAGHRQGAPGDSRTTRERPASPS